MVRPQSTSAVPGDAAATSYTDRQQLLVVEIAAQEQNRASRLAVAEAFYRLCTFHHYGQAGAQLYSHWIWHTAMSRKIQEIAMD